MTWFSTAVFVAFCFGIIDAAALPKGLTKCPPKDDSCLASSIQSAFKLFASGSRQYGVLPLEPLYIKHLVIPAGNNAVKLEQIHDDVNFHGITEAKVTSASFNSEELILEFVLKSDTSFSSDSKYKFNGKVLLFDLNSSGNMKVTFEKGTLTNKLKFKAVEKNGKKYLEVVDYNLKIKAEKMVFFADNLFGGNKQLSDSFLATVNESWESLYDEVSVNYESAYATTFKSMANQFFSRVPMDEIF